MDLLQLPHQNLLDLRRPHTSGYLSCLEHSIYLILPGIIGFHTPLLMNGLSNFVSATGRHLDDQTPKSAFRISSWVSCAGDVVFTMCTRTFDSNLEKKS